MGLQGTRRRCDDPYRCGRSGTFHTVESGAGPRGNAHIGVAVSFDATYVRLQDIVEVQVPPRGQLRGRAVGARVRQGDAIDIMVYSIYYPPSSPAHDELYKALNDWVRVKLLELPQRCTPIVLTDVNVRMGIEQNTEFPAAIGGTDLERTSRHSHLFAAMLTETFLVAVNTVYTTGPTYYSTMHASSSRIDYICIPRCMVTTGVRWVTIPEGAAAELQLVRSRHKADHRPVIAALPIRL